MIPWSPGSVRHAEQGHEGEYQSARLWNAGDNGIDLCVAIVTYHARANAGNSQELGIKIGPPTSDVVLNVADGSPTLLKYAHQRPRKPVGAVHGKIGM